MCHHFAYLIQFSGVLLFMILLHVPFRGLWGERSLSIACLSIPSVQLFSSGYRIIINFFFQPHDNWPLHRNQIVALPYTANYIQIMLETTLHHQSAISRLVLTMLKAHYTYSLLLFSVILQQFIAGGDIITGTSVRE